MMDAEFMARGVVFAAAVWILGASVWRLNLMQWGRHQCLRLASYILIAIWSFGQVLGVPDMDAFGVIGVALLLLAGRRRWEHAAPEDTAR